MPPTWPKPGLDVAVLERNTYIGGATVSRELHKDWTYSNCSYVCSLLRPEIARDLELPRHGLQVVPYGGGVTFKRDGDYYGNYYDHDRQYREMAGTPGATPMPTSATPRT